MARTGDDLHPTPSTKWWPGFVVVAIALGANLWMLLLQFQFCDYDEIPRVGWMLGLESIRWTEWGIPAQPFHHRPAFWAVIWLLLQAGAAKAWVFHLVFLCSHAAASWLLYRILRDRSGLLAGVVGGVLFAILPGGMQAVTWIAAGGDQLAVLFMLVAVVAGDRVLRKGSRMGALACGAATFCAVGSKETAIALLPALALACWFPPADSSPSRLRRMCVLIAGAIGMAAAWIVRARATGSFMPGYPNGVQPELSHVAALPAVFLGFLMPWNRSAEFLSLAPGSAVILRRLEDVDDASISTILRTAIAISALALFLAGFAGRTRRGRLALILLLGALVAVIIPVLPLVQSGVNLSRAWYPASALFAALVACASVRATGRTAGKAAAWLIPLVLLTLDGFIHFARTELHVASAIRHATDAFEKRVREAPETLFVVLDPPRFMGGTAFLGPSFAGVVAPPFGNAPLPPVGWSSATTLSRCWSIAEDAHALQILAWDGRELFPRGPALLPVPDELPALAADEGKDSQSFKPASPVAPRGIAGIRMRLPPGGGSSTGVVTWTAGAQVRKVPFAGTADGDVVVGFPDASFDERWITSLALDTVRVEGIPLDGPPVLVRRLAGIRMHSPVGYVLLGVPPRVTFLSSLAAPFFRVTLEFVLPDEVRIPIAWTVPSSELPRDPDGSQVFVADQPATVMEGQLGMITWKEIAARLRPHVSASGWGLRVDARIEGLDASRVNTVARSEWRPLVLLQRP